MRLPTLGDYVSAFQQEAFAFTVEELKAGRVARQLDGKTVKSWSGSFAVTFEVQTGSARQAIRCFTNASTDLDDIQKRYSLIRSAIKTVDTNSLLPVEYLADCVRTFSLPAMRFPIIRMPWVEGSPISDWVKQWHATANLKELRDFTRRFIDIVDRLGQAHIAHGDLQHGNVLVRPNGSIVLVDYDGMFVPGMLEQGLNLSNERGHPNYQHPDRNAQFDERLDRFASMVIVTALHTLEADRAAWDQFSNGGDNLLFAADDFKDPDRPGGIFRYLKGIPAERELGARLTEISRGRFDDIPTLAEFLRPWTPFAPVPTRQHAPTPRPSGTFLLNLFGEAVLEAPFVRLQNPGPLDLGKLPGLRARLAHLLTGENRTDDIQWVYQSHAAETVVAGVAVQGARGQGINPYLTADHRTLTDTLEPDWLAQFTRTTSVSDVPEGYWVPGAVLPPLEDFLVRLYATYHEFRLNGLHLGNSAFASFLVGIHRRMVSTQDGLVHFEDLEALRSAQAHLLAIYDRPNWDQGTDSETVLYLRRVRNKWWSTPGARWSW